MKVILMNNKELRALKGVVIDPGHPSLDKPDVII